MEKKEWLFNLVEDFRRQIKNEYSQYAEFFHIFSDKVSYVSLILWKVEYDNVLRNYELRVYETEFRDKFEEKFTLNYSSTSGESPEVANIIENDNNWEFEQSLWGDDYDPITQPMTDLIRPDEIINLPSDFLEKSVKISVKRIIDSDILEKLRNLQNQVIIKKSINRLSLINSGDITNIQSFLDDDWTLLNDNCKSKMLVKIFSLLGFETIPIELLLQNPKYSEFNNLAHPEMIIYDINSNYIVLIEELTELNQKYIFKKDVAISVIKKFSSFFPIPNRKLSYMIIVNKTIKIDLNHYNIKERIILKEELANKLKEIFNPDFLQKNLFHYSNKRKIKELIDFIKKK
jgi:hypothetical protein